MSSRRRWSIAVSCLIGLSACHTGERPAPSTISASTVLQDLHLSTQVPPPFVETQHAVTPSSLTEPIILRKMQSLPASADRKREGEGAISLNFDKASLRSVIDAVLGDALGVAYSVDERVDGVVTLVSPRKLTREEALEVLDGVLRTNGATLIKGDNLYRVVLTANARQNLPGPKPGADQPGFGVSVYVPSHTAATSLQKLIEPLYQISGALAADAERNLLLVTGSVEERRALIEAAHLFDQDWLANQSVGIFPLARARPKAVVEELKALYSPGGAAGTDVPTVRFSALERLNAVMVVALQASGLDQARDWIARLDQTGPGERGLHVYAAHYANVQSLAKLLNRLLSTGNGGAETGNAALPQGVAGSRLTSAATAAPSGSAPPTVPTGAVGAGMASTGGFGSGDHSLAKEDIGADSDQAGESGNGARVIADPASHSLLILANQAEFRMVEQALARLDAKPVQILIEATIVEVTLNKTLQYGVQYFLRGTRIGNQQDSSVGFTSASASGTITGIAPGFNGVLGTIANPSVILSALDQVTDSKVLSSPQLLVTDSHEAMLKVGTQTPLLTQQVVSTISGNAPTVNSVDYHDTGVILRVLPRSNDADMVSLDIAQEVSQVVPSAANPLTPDIDQRRIESSVTVQSGQTVMLGGLISENNSLTRSGLPGASSLPWIGGIFGETTDSRVRTELVVFITPHILHDGDDVKRLTEELVGRLQSMRPTAP